MTITTATLPPGWTPYGIWPPSGSRVDVLHPDGDVSRGVRYLSPTTAPE